METTGLKSAPLEIGDRTFTTTQFAAMDSLGIMVSLVRLLGPTIAAILGANQKANISDIAPQLSAALAVVKPEEMKALVLTMLSNTSTTHKGKFVTLNKQERIDQVFAGRLQDLMRVFAHAVEVNFGDFFAEMLQSAPPDLEQAETISASLE